MKYDFKINVPPHGSPLKILCDCLERTYVLFWFGGQKLLIYVPLNGLYETGAIQCSKCEKELVSEDMLTTIKACYLLSGTDAIKKYWISLGYLEL